MLNAARLHIGFFRLWVLLPGDAAGGRWQKPGAHLLLRVLDSRSRDDVPVVRVCTSYVGFLLVNSAWLAQWHFKKTEPSGSRGVRGLQVKPVEWVTGAGGAGCPRLGGISRRCLGFPGGKQGLWSQDTKQEEMETAGR